MVEKSFSSMLQNDWKWKKKRWKGREKWEEEKHHLELEWNVLIKLIECYTQHSNQTRGDMRSDHTSRSRTRVLLERRIWWWWWGKEAIRMGEPQHKMGSGAWLNCWKHNEIGRRREKMGKKREWIYWDSMNMKRSKLIGKALQQHHTESDVWQWLRSSQ